MTSRTLLAVALFVGFYAFGLLLVLALFWLPWAQIRYSDTMGPSGFLAAAGALYILWALIPPRTPWVAPGPELSAASQQGLHTIIGDIARKTRHAVPHAVYLVKEPTAFASSRPRWYGLRREPVVGIGLPLFALLAEDELAAALAHEFGHHVGGDVKLGPWQHRTFSAIAAALHRLDGSNVFLHLPFYWYARLFLRVTGTASREQELRADALAAGTVSPRALGGALIALEQYGESWWEYWFGVFVPAVDAGFLPPILEGYQRFLAAAPPPPLATARPGIPPADHDTHPPLDVRLTALGVPLFSREDRGHCASLLGDLAQNEQRLLAPQLTDATVLGRLVPISWDEWGRQVLPAVWRQSMESRRESLRSVEISSLPTLLSDDSAWWVRLNAGVNIYSPAARRKQLCAWLARWVGLWLLDSGFRLISGPGAEPVLEGAGLQVKPTRWVDDLASGARSAAEWRAVVEQVAAHAATTGDSKGVSP